MKYIYYIFILSISMFNYAQTVMNITYIDVPRENAEEFLELHVKFSNLSMSEDRKLINHGIFAHAFAGNYTFALYDFYKTASDIDLDADLVNQVLKKNIDAMKLSKKEEKALTEEYRKYFRMYAENHSDQIRVANENVFYESNSLDWSKSMVVTLSKYDVKWGQANSFKEAWDKGQFELYKNDTGVKAVYGSNHLYGSGMSLHIYTFYENWSAFAAFENANSGRQMNDTDRTFWSAVENHEDEILNWIGGLNPETKQVVLAE